jgi:hypothetical protein
VGLRSLLAAIVVAAGLTLVSPPADAAAPVNTVPPTITGKAEYAAVLTADPGEWSPPPSGYTYQWLRDGKVIDGALGQTHRAALADIGHRLSVVVTAHNETDESASATSAETGPVRRADFRAKGGQKIVGVARYGHTLTARDGRWSPRPTALRYQWHRNGEDVKGATDGRYPIRPDDVGARLRVTITANAPGYKPLSVTTDRTDMVRHRVDARRTVRYHVETRGHITTSVRDFARLAQETYDDPRGWRGAGIEFRRVAHGGAFTLVLSEARLVPSFSSICSAMWSCRVGRFVIINQERWKHASPAWNAAHAGLRGYRHMVLNHETGHWLGLGHAGCPGPGRLAPVMMQQSKGLRGCRFNPFPTRRELASRTPHGRGVADAVGHGYARAQSE